VVEVFEAASTRRSSLLTVSIPRMQPKGGPYWKHHLKCSLLSLVTVASTTRSYRPFCSNECSLSSATGCLLCRNPQMHISSRSEFWL
jgi:hypothetical protein